MIRLQAFIVESLDVEKLKHLEHAEDHIIHGGHEGVSHAHDTMMDVIKVLEGKPTKTKITTKYDGAPSIVFGINPENGKFFVASKSAFNKNPKLNYTMEDIEKNHGHAPGLVAKLKEALTELPKIMPKNGGVYQGDLMYTASDIKDDGDSYSFTPNTITYHAAKGSAQGRSVANAKLGLVVHTKYVGKKLDDMKASFDVDQGAFKTDPDVHMINPELGPASISPIEKKKFEKHIEAAEQLYAGMEPDVFDVLDGHDITMKTYINELVRKGTWKSASAEGYLNFLTDRARKEIDKVKTESSKQKKMEQFELVAQHIKNHMKQFNAIFKLHSTLQQAKDTLIGALARADNGFTTTIGGESVKPEGFVAIRNGRPTKLVDRAEFSRSNFLRGSFQKMGEPEPESKMPKKPIVFAFGRMNPPTIGHGALVDKVKELAKENKADHQIVLSASQDEEKNPLSPEQKLKHAKRFFPGANIIVADKDAPNFLKQAQRLHQAGHDHLIMVAGSDRVEEFKKTLEQYNGEGEGKLFNFKKIDVVSAGDRDPDAEGVTGMSASKMRAHALNGKKKEFAKGIPSHVKPEHVDELYNDVRQAMDVKIDANTSGISLARYAKRKDRIGTLARAEVERRHKMKDIEKTMKQRARAAKRALPTQMTPPRKKVIRPKAIKEDAMTSSGGDVRGLGFVTGDPGNLDQDFLQTWTQLNIADADTRDNILKGVVKDNHTDLHKDLPKPQQADPKKNAFIQKIMSTLKGRS
jgi:Family of unknown function (DUF6267)/Cytidylyltransferase-like